MAQPIGVNAKQRLYAEGKWIETSQGNGPSRAAPPPSGGARQSRLTTDHSCARTGRTLACAHGPWPLPVCHACRPERAS